VTAAKSLGCIAIGLGLLPPVLFFLANAALGDCPTGNDCMSETTRALMFYGSPIAWLVVMAFVYRGLSKDS
jgi:hypothetical protein